MITTNSFFNEVTNSEGIKVNILLKEDLETKIYKQQQKINDENSRKNGGFVEYIK